MTLLTAHDVAIELNIPLRSAYAVMHRMMHVRRGRCIHVTRQALDVFLRDNTHQPNGERHEVPAYAGPYVYFIEAPALSLVKIGWSKGHPKERLGTLQIGSPTALTLIGFIPGDNWAEKRLHRRFARHRSHGEWFRIGPRMRSAIRKLLADDQA